ncbi:1-(5-phosphoribosyl)-5-[(5-phosphoribosylamino)methylideneamino]imidazole-4-carboxamide isomerase [Chlamydiota bacterium]
MDIYPAIDIKQGKCVRLEQGLEDKEKVYSEDPVSMGLHWQNEGAKFLHIVDLDGAFTGKLVHISLVENIVKSLALFSQCGGGIRELDDIEMLLSAGVSRAIIGTKACEDYEFIEQAVRSFSSRIAVGLDAKNGKIAIKGWKEMTDVKPSQLALLVQKIGIKTVIYTDISTDGMMKGPNFAGIEALVDATSLEVIASGGISSNRDIMNLRKLEYKGVTGAIVGKALYEEKVRLRDIL